MNKSLNLALDLAFENAGLSKVEIATGAEMHAQTINRIINKPKAITGATFERLLWGMRFDVKNPKISITETGALRLEYPKRAIKPMNNGKTE